MRLVVQTVALRQVFLLVLMFSPVSFIPLMLHTYLYLNTTFIRTDEWSLRTFTPCSAVYDIGEQEEGKYFQTVSL
jgi:hypothetical protein